MSPRRRSNPADTEHLRSLGLIVAILIPIVLLGVVLNLAAVLTAGVTGGGWYPPSGDTWIPVALAVLLHPAALPAPWGSALSGHAGLLWTLVTVLGLIATAAVIILAVTGWRRFGPIPPGHATRAEIRRELGEAAARRTAAVTRPTMPAEWIRSAPLTQLATPCHRCQTGRLWVPLENPTGALAPTQSSKSRGELVHKAIEAPGPLLCSTTKPDLLEFSGLTRARRSDLGPVWVLDATNSVSWPALRRWSPIRGCDTAQIARRRAEAMVSAAAVGLQEVGGNDKVFQGRATIVVQAYLLAAHADDRGVATLVEWATTRDLDPVELLQPTYPELARNLRQELSMVAETADAVWLSVRRAMEPFMDPDLRDLCTPTDEDAFDVDELIDQRASLYLIAGELQTASAAPILTALVSDVLTTAQERALRQHHRRLDPPLTAVLDEINNATPVPNAPSILADSAGRGINIHWAAQSRAQLENAYGEKGARSLLDNTTALSVYPGLSDETTLKWVSTLTDYATLPRYQAHSDGALSPGRTSVGTEDVPTYRPGAVRTQDGRGSLLLLYRHLRPIAATLVDVNERDDWPQIQRDIETIRAGDAPLDRHGYLLDTSGARP